MYLSIQHFGGEVEALLQNYKYVFSWSYKELKGIPRQIFNHKIELMIDAKPFKQR
jgi:hypothetical protein